MSIHVYTIVRNEAYILPFFLRHYAPIADRIFVIDDGSTDETPAIVKACPNATLLPYSRTTGLDEQAIADEYRDQIQAHSRGVADWVLCPDADELLYNAALRGFLANARKHGFVAVKAAGYIMIGEVPEEDDRRQLWETCRLGVREPRYDKTIILNPEIHFAFGVGRHRTTIASDAQVFRSEGGMVRLLHYCYFSPAYIEARIRRNFARVPNAHAGEMDYRLARARESYARMYEERSAVI